MATAVPQEQGASNPKGKAQRQKEEKAWRERPPLSLGRRQENNTGGKSDRCSVPDVTERRGERRTRAGDGGSGRAGRGRAAPLLFLEASCLLVTYYVHFDCKYGFAFPNGRVE